MESVGRKEEDVLDRTKWKNDIHNHSGDPWKNHEKKNDIESSRDDSACPETWQKYSGTNITMQ